MKDEATDSGAEGKIARDATARYVERDRGGQKSKVVCARVCNGTLAMVKCHWQWWLPLLVNDLRFQ